MVLPNHPWVKDADEENFNTSNVMVLPLKQVFY